MAKATDPVEVKCNNCQKTFQLVWRWKNEPNRIIQPTLIVHHFKTLSEYGQLVMEKIEVSCPHCKAFRFLE